MLMLHISYQLFTRISFDVPLTLPFSSPNNLFFFISNMLMGTWKSSKVTFWQKIRSFPGNYQIFGRSFYIACNFFMHQQAVARLSSLNRNSALDLHRIQCDAAKYGQLAFPEITNEYSWKLFLHGNRYALHGDMKWEFNCLVEKRGKFKNDSLKSGNRCKRIRSHH